MKLSPPELKPLWLTPFLILVLLHSGLSFADSDPCLGPPTKIDLEPEMPPVESQAESPWCSTFVAKALLDYNLHRACEKRGRDHSCRYTPETQLSPVDINSLDSSRSLEERGRTYTVSDGASVYDLLEGVQRSGALSESQLPFDQTFFEDRGGLSLFDKLSTYYERQTAADVSSEGCPIPAQFQALLRQFPRIQKILERFKSGANGESGFLNEVAGKYSPIPDRLQSDRRPVLKFEITQFVSSDSDRLKAHILGALQDKEPLSTTVCEHQLMKRTGLPDLAGSDAKDPCGSHEMALIGFRRTAKGKCQIHLRNSWGKDWPGGPKSDGDVWVDMATYLKTVDRGKNGSVVLDSIRPARSKPMNHMIHDSFRYDGKTWAGNATVGTASFSDGEKEKGRFNSEGAFIQGVWSVQDGSFKSGIFDQHGKLRCGIIHVPPYGSRCLRNGILDSRPVKSIRACRCSAP